MRFKFYKTFPDRIKFYHVFLAIMVCILLSFLYVNFSSQTIAPEILEQIQKNKEKEVHLLEKNKMQIFFMKERGWSFIFLACFVLSIAIGINLSNQRKRRINFVDYKYRIEDKIAQSEIRVLNFQERLKYKFDLLTWNDLLIAEMLADGLSTKEISSQLNISSASTNTARYRLRKKMKLSSETNLVTFLRQI